MLAVQLRKLCLQEARDTNDIWRWHKGDIVHNSHICCQATKPAKGLSEGLRHVAYIALMLWHTSMMLEHIIRITYMQHMKKEAMAHDKAGVLWFLCLHRLCMEHGDMKVYTHYA